MAHKRRNRSDRRTKSRTLKGKLVDVGEAAREKFREAVDTVTE